ncbi:MAG: YncE family protein [Ilumatobacteraceae bacterium]
MSQVSRVRWAAIGAAIAVSLGAGGWGIVNATVSSGPKSVYVPIVPCRLADTRGGMSTVGLRNTPIGPAEFHSFVVHGTNGNCTIPSGATAIVANVTAVNPTARGYMTLWPAGESMPTASSLNYLAGQAPVPNAVTVTLSGGGKMSVFNSAGTVNVIIDIAGYYEDHHHDDRYDTKAEVDAKIVERTNRLTDAQIAMLRWDQDPGRAATIAVGQNPYGVVFDGTSIWVSNAADGTLSKVDPATNTVLDTFSVGSTSYGLAFDGDDIWISSGSNFVSRFDRTSNTVVATVTTDAYPSGIAFDGTHIWVANTMMSSVSKIDPATNTVVATLTGISGAYGVAYDGTSIWVVSGFSNSVKRIDPATNTVIATVAVGQDPYNVAYDGTSIWVTNAGTNNVSKIDPATNAVVATIAVGTNPYGVAYDGTSVWVTNIDSDAVSKINPSTNAVVATVAVGDSPQGIAYDGTNLWIANAFADTMTKVLSF